MKGCCHSMAIFLFVIAVRSAGAHPQAAEPAEPVPLAAPVVSDRAGDRAGDRAENVAEEALFCIICTDLVHEIAEYLNTSVNWTAAEKVLQNFCHQLPSESEKIKCYVAIRVLAPLVYDIIITRLNPRKVCEEMSLCIHTNKMAPREAPPLPASSSSLLSLLSGSPGLARHFPFLLNQCSLCRDLVHFAQAIVTYNATEKMVLNGVDELCPKMSRGMQPQCSSLLRQFAYTVLVMAADRYLKPAPVCEAFELCSQPN